MIDLSAVVFTLFRMERFEEGGKVPVPGMDRATLAAVQEALREEGSPETAVLDRLLAETAEGTSSSLTPVEAFRVFAVLIGIEWRRGKQALCGGVTVCALVTAWRTQSGIEEIGGGTPDL